MVLDLSSSVGNILVTVFVLLIKLPDFHPDCHCRSENNLLSMSVFFSIIVDETRNTVPEHILYPQFATVNFSQ